MPDTVIKPLKKPWRIGGQEATDFEVRPSTMQDVCDAEQKATPMHPNSFTIEMACLQIVRVGTFAGPFAPSHFKALPSARFAAIRDAMQEADLLGED